MRVYGECGIVSKDKGVKRDGEFRSAGDGMVYHTGVVFVAS